MDTIVKHQKVPVFSKYALDIAELCAKDLWRGISYKDGKPLLKSDEEFLAMFASPFLSYALTGFTNHKNPITADSINALIDVAKLNPMRLSSKTTDIQKGIDTLYFGVSKLLTEWMVNNDKKSSKAIGLEATERLGEEFFTISAEKKKGSFIALSNRLLYFAMPNIPIYIYSKGIAEKLGFKTSKPSEIIADYTETLHEGYIENWNSLSNYEMPFSNNVVSERLWLIARDNGWWQRRVYDMALVLHLTGVKPREYLLAIALTKARLHP
jgi:hypothetical protein